MFWSVFDSIWIIIVRCGLVVWEIRFSRFENQTHGILSTEILYFRNAWMLKSRKAGRELVLVERKEGGERHPGRDMGCWGVREDKEEGRSWSGEKNLTTLACTPPVFCFFPPHCMETNPFPPVTWFTCIELSPLCSLFLLLYTHPIPPQLSAHHQPPHLLRTFAFCLFYLSTSLLCASCT